MAGRPTRTSREDWVVAAFEAASRGGVDAIAVEPIAATLGVSKGGFYYRFASREELIAETLAYWSAYARELMEGTAGIADPVERLRVFLRRAMGDDRLRGVDSWFFLHSSTHPLVRPLARAAAEENVTWFAAVLAESGLSPGHADRRARLCWSSYLAMVAELRALGDDPSGERHIGATADLLVDLVVARPRQNAARE